jgi:hypothetical protein
MKRIFMSYPSFKTGIIVVSANGDVTRITLNKSVEGEMLVEKELGKLYSLDPNYPEFSTLHDPNKRHDVVSEILYENEYLTSTLYAETQMSFVDYVNQKLDDLFVSKDFPGSAENQAGAVLGVLRTRIKRPSESRLDLYEADNFFTASFDYKKGDRIGTLHWNTREGKLDIVRFYTEFSRHDSDDVDIYVVAESTSKRKTIFIDEVNLNAFLDKFPYSLLGKLWDKPQEKYQKELKEKAEVMNRNLHENPLSKVNQQTVERFNQLTEKSETEQLTAKEAKELKSLATLINH